MSSTEPMHESDYFAAKSDFASERDRLRLLESIEDPVTFAQLARLPIPPGGRCADVGAGSGSVARWLAGKVGGDGEVVAVDIDPRFLDAAHLPSNVVVRRHDIRLSPFERDRFDLVYSRALLEHLPDPLRAIVHMTEGLRPGGWLVAAAADFTTLRATAPDHPCNEGFERLLYAFVAFARSGPVMDLAMAPRIPRLLEQAGLVDVGSEGWTCECTGASPHAVLLRESVERVNVRYGKVGASAEDLAVFRRALDDSSFRFAFWTRLYAWGRRKETS